jgi:ubiquinone/menaquinone biosynthesis C-methylase UbiE
VVDLGIGLPSDSDFYKFYLKSNCYLRAYDPDSRLGGNLKLSDKCIIYNKSSENMNEIFDNSVDVVVALSSLEHYPFDSFIKTLKEVSRILKKNGQLLVTLDLTFDKEKSAKWAILEKTINGLPKEENDLSLNKNSDNLTLESFVKILSPFFYLKNEEIKNSNLKKNRLIYSKKYNSYIAYMRFYKK